ncbi:hypothetical protein AVM02_02450 [Brucella anthropi]|uniref:hypothetical protein n=1 Tax=Brucella anthropi TaxID=529 RepID=UPI003986E762
MIKLAPVTEDNIWFVLHNLREEDRKEFLAILPVYNLAFVAASTLHHSVMSWAAVDAETGEPVAIFGAANGGQYPGVCTVFAFGTERWGEALHLITKHILGYMIPHLKAAGFHRAECMALSNRTDIHRWMKLLGGRPEAVLSERSTTREDITVYVWKANENEAN